MNHKEYFLKNKRKALIIKSNRKVYNEMLQYILVIIAIIGVMIAMYYTIWFLYFIIS